MLPIVNEPPPSDSDDPAEEELTLGHLAHLQRLASAGLLSAGFIHNLANLLIPLAGGIERALMSDDPVVHRKALVEADAYAAQATELTRGYLDFARRDQFDRADVAVLPVVESAISTLQAQATRYGVAIVREAYGAHTARVDKTRLLQIVLNLLSNAVRAAREGGFTVTVRIRGKQDRVIIEVEDNGPGIEPEIVQRLYEPFVHGGDRATTLDADAQDGRTAGESRRTGLGLFITRKLVEEQQAKIHFHTQRGSGTIFRVALKESRAAARERSSNAESADGSSDPDMADADTTEPNTDPLH